MPTPPVKRFTAWSYSRYRDHDVCAYAAKLKHLDKVPEGPKGPALVRGEAIHKLAEDYVGRKLARLPSELANFAGEFKHLRKVGAATEGKWAVTVDWRPVDFFDWGAAWLRVVLDAHYKPAPDRVKVIDYKTGKIYGSNEEQLELYALAAFAKYPEVDFVITELWYLDQGQILPSPPATYAAKDAPKLRTKWRKKVIPLLTDTRFRPTPGEHCARCAYSQRRNGPCQF